MKPPIWMMTALASICVAGADAGYAQNALTEFDPERSVELKSINGETRVIGELVGVEDGLLIIKTELGNLRLSANAVNCDGPGCPAKSDGTGFSIHVSKDIELAIVAELLQDYAIDTGAQLEFLEASDLGERIVRLTDPDTSISTDIAYFSGASGFLALAEETAQISIQDVSINDELGGLITGPAIDEITSSEFQYLIAQDGVVVAINPQNPVRNLSRSEIAKVFSGEISNWLELGGGNRQISVYGLNENHVRNDYFSQYFLNAQTGTPTTAATLLNTDTDVLNAVQEDIGAIGFLSRAHTDGAKTVAIRENCGLLTSPNSFTIKTDGYPLTHPVYAYRSPGDVDPKARDLFKWMSSARSQEAIRRSGYVDTGLERINLEDMGMMLIHSAAVETDFSISQYSGMLRDLRDAERLSVSFRFETGSTDLDDTSKQELADLGQRLTAGEFAGLELLVIGFADSTGAASVNTQIAEQRARAVRDILVDTVGTDVASRLRMRPVSYGELLPLACNDEEVGRSRNRRVEIWVRRLGVRTN